MPAASLNLSFLACMGHRVTDVQKKATDAGTALIEAAKIHGACTMIRSLLRDRPGGRASSKLNLRSVHVLAADAVDDMRECRRC